MIREQRPARIASGPAGSWHFLRGRTNSYCYQQKAPCSLVVAGVGAAD